MTCKSGLGNSLQKNNNGQHATNLRYSMYEAKSPASINAPKFNNMQDFRDVILGDAG